MPRSYFTTSFFIAFLAFTVFNSEKGYALVSSYEECIQRIDENPDAAFESAIQWQSLGGGYGARHCVALALHALNLYDEAAVRLETLARDMVAAEPWQKAELLTQAANAWLLWGANERALTLLNSAIETAPAQPSAWIDRARLHMEAGRPFEALGDLNQAVELAPFREEGLIFRGNAHRVMGNYDKSRADLHRAIELAPTTPEAWLELGNLEKENNNPDLARSYWLKTRTLATSGPVAEAALKNLERLDVNIEEGHAGTDNTPASFLPRISGSIQKSN